MEVWTWFANIMSWIGLGLGGTFLYCIAVRVFDSVYEREVIGSGALPVRWPLSCIRRNQYEF